MGSRVGWCVVLLANIEVLTIGLPLNFLCQRTLGLYHVTPTFLGVSKETLTKRLDPVSQKQGYENCWVKARIPGTYL